MIYYLYQLQNLFFDLSEIPEETVTGCLNYVNQKFLSLIYNEAYIDYAVLQITPKEDVVQYINNFLDILFENTNLQVFNNQLLLNENIKFLNDYSKVEQNFIRQYLISKILYQSYHTYDQRLELLDNFYQLMTIQVNVAQDDLLWFIQEEAREFWLLLIHNATPELYEYHLYDIRNQLNFAIQNGEKRQYLSTLCV